MVNTSVILSPKTIARSMRYKVRKFQTRDAMHRFLNTADNAVRWRECSADEPCKSGTYVYAGGAYHNVRSLDVCALAHL